MTKPDSLPDGWVQVDPFILRRADGLSIHTENLRMLMVGVPESVGWRPTNEEWRSLWTLLIGPTIGESDEKFMPAMRALQFRKGAPSIAKHVRQIDSIVARRNTGTSEATLALEARIASLEAIVIKLQSTIAKRTWDEP